MQSPQSPPRRQLVLVNGVIHPSAADGSPVPALAVADGRIVHAGAIDRARSLLPDAPRLDLGGRVVLPAFIDSHTHFHRAAVLRALFLDFEALRPGSIAEVIGHVRIRADSLPAGTWIQGDSISAAQLAERRLPDRRDLDAAAPDHPVLIRGIGKHVVAVNSAALWAASIDRDTPDPPGGRIERDADGEPTGILHERAKLRLDASAVDTVVPKPTAFERASALTDGVATMHSLGVSTIHEMVRQPEEAADWAALHAADALRLRIRLYYRVHESPISLGWLTALGIRSGWGDPWLSVGGVKISVDGWCIFQNAAVYEPYLGERSGRGLMRIEPDELTHLVRAADQAGLRVAVHAVGARAVDAALDAFDAATPWQRGPHRLEHAHLDLDHARLRRIADLGLTLSAQPGFLDAYLPDWRLGLAPGRIQRIMPLATAHELGIQTLINSDVPSGPLGPLSTIRAAVERRAGGGTVGAVEGLDPITAWRAHSTTAADVTADPTTGRLEVGRHADLIVLDEDPFASSELPTNVGATLIDGEVVHDPHGWLA